jgi:hypothetical protein
MILYVLTFVKKVNIHRKLTQTDRSDLGDERVVLSL